jgi:hypothetical protein
MLMQEPSSNLHLRGIPAKVMLRLKQEAKKQETSVNFLVIKLIEQGIGFSFQVKKHMHHELDALAGTWSESDFHEFEKHTADFGKIDKDLWS